MGKTKGSFGFHWVQHKHAWGHTRLCCSFFWYVREKPWRKAHDWRPNQDSAFEPAKSRILRPKARWYPFNVVGHHFRDKTPQVAPQYRIRCRIRCRIRYRTITYTISYTIYNTTSHTDILHIFVCHMNKTCPKDQSLKVCLYIYHYFSIDSMADGRAL